MSLADYAGLKASIAAWLKRADLAAQIPSFVALAEARIARDLRLRAQLVEGSALTVPGVSTVGLPAGWLEFESLQVAGYGRLDPAPADASEDRYACEPAGRPRDVAVRGAALRLWPTPDDVYTLNWSFYRRFELTDASPMNWLLTNHPSIYLWASLAEAEPFVVNDPRAVTWEAKYQADAEKLRVSDDRARFGGTPMRIRAG